MAATTGKKSSRMDFSNEINKSLNPEQTTTPTSTKKENKKGKSGRPSNGDVKKISLAIPVESLEGVEAAAALFYKGNVTAYINDLIKKDLQENLKKYKTFLDMAKSREQENSMENDGNGKKKLSWETG